MQQRPLLLRMTVDQECFRVSSIFDRHESLQSDSVLHNNHALDALNKFVMQDTNSTYCKN